MRSVVDGTIRGAAIGLALAVIALAWHMVFETPIPSLVQAGGLSLGAASAAFIVTVVDARRWLT